MKENFKLGFKLMIITAIAGALLGIVNNMTKDIIIENSKINKSDLAILLPGATGINEAELDVSGNINEVYEAVNDSGENQGYVVKITAKGFHGPIELMVGLKDDVISGIKVLSHSETPGLGAKIVEDNFKERFVSVPYNNGITMVKTEPSKDGEVMAITGATVSSNAIGSALNEVINFYKENVKGEAGIEIEQDATTSASQG